MWATVMMLFVAMQGAAPPANRPDYSGQWVINAGASDFGLIPPPQCRGLKLSHREPELLLEETHPDGRLCGVSLRYTTDGTPVPYVANGANVRGRLTWTGSALVIVRTGEDDVTMRIEASLSADGKRLTRAFSVDSPQGSTEWTYVYDRQ